MEFKFSYNLENYEVINYDKVAYSDHVNKTLSVMIDDYYEDIDEAISNWFNNLANGLNQAEYVELAVLNSDIAELEDINNCTETFKVKSIEMNYSIVTIVVETQVNLNDITLVKSVLNNVFKSFLTDEIDVVSYFYNVNDNQFTGTCTIKTIPT